MDWEEKLIKAVRETMQGFWPGHDFFHIQRVYNLCLKLGKKLNADLEILKAAALLHDVAYMQEKEGKVRDHAEKSAEIAKSLLLEVGFPKEKIESVVYAIKIHGFRKQIKPKTLEAKILQDADRLDAIGAIGIARCFVDSGLRNQILWDPKVKPKKAYDKSHSAINHFYEKLLKIKDQLNLKESQKLAEKKHRFMLQFLDEFYKEWKL